MKFSISETKHCGFLNLQGKSEKHKAPLLAYVYTLNLIFLDSSAIEGSFKLFLTITTYEKGSYEQVTI